VAPNEIIKYSILSLNNGDTDLHDIVFREIFDSDLTPIWESIHIILRENHIYPPEETVISYETA
jgi:conserved repeat protein